MSSDLVSGSLMEHSFGMPISARRFGALGGVSVWFVARAGDVMNMVMMVRKIFNNYFCGLLIFNDFNRSKIVDKMMF